MRALSVSCSCQLGQNFETRSQVGKVDLLESSRACSHRFSSRVPTIKVKIQRVLQVDWTLVVSSVLIAI